MGTVLVILYLAGSIGGRKKPGASSRKLSLRQIEYAVFLCENKKMKALKILLLITLICAPALSAADQRVKVMTLGVFHFEFPNLDLMQTGKNDQIDVLQPGYQAEIEEIVAKLRLFQPTFIVIEMPPADQAGIDALYQSYVREEHVLGRAEEQQIGFRFARSLGLSRLTYVDEQGNFSENIKRLLVGEAEERLTRFERHFTENPDIGKKSYATGVYKTRGIKAELLQLNDPQRIKKDLGNYLIGAFKYEEHPYDFTWVDFESSRWFNRNLKIFRNIQRIEAKPGDRILVIFGAGHMNLLNFFIECSKDDRSRA